MEHADTQQNGSKRRRRVLSKGPAQRRGGNHGNGRKFRKGQNSHTGEVFRRGVDLIPRDSVKMVLSALMNDDGTLAGEIKDDDTLPDSDTWIARLSGLPRDRPSQPAPGPKRTDPV